MDQALAFLLENGSLTAMSEVEQHVMQNELGLTKDELTALFLLLKRDGFITDWSRKSSLFMFCVDESIIPFLHKGGYTARHLIVKNQMALLEAELQKIKPSIPLESFNNITGVMANVIQFFS